MSPAPQQRAQPVWPLAGLGAVAIITLLLMVPGPMAGDLTGSDDMMRMQQIRDLIAGQAWYDVSQSRLLTPEGGAMHWSRLPDLVPAGMVWLLQPLVGPSTAESIAATAWPMLQLIWAFVAITVCLRRLGAGMPAQLLAILFFVASFALGPFLPGRIDHHGLGVALTLTTLACLLSPRLTARSALTAAGCTAAMITIAIENLPAVGLVISSFGIAWIVRGGPETNRLRLFGGALIVACLFAYVFDAPGAGGNRAVCDAYGQSHFVALLVAGAGLFAIATFFPETRDWRTRTGAMALAGIATALSFAATSPANFDALVPSCLGDPYANLPEQVRTSWLKNVAEARALPAVFATDVFMGLFVYGYAASGLVAALIQYRLAPRTERLGWALLSIFCILAFALVSWQVRAAPLAHALATISTAALLGRLYVDWRQKRGSRAVFILLLAVLFATPIGWNMPSLFKGDAPPAARRDAACKSADAYVTIAAAPRMIAFTPIDLGAPLIYHTRHYATAAPYHRNPAGIALAISVFTGPPDAARGQIERTGATHLLYCRGLPELRTYAANAPDGLAAALERQNTPEWLVPVSSSQNGGGPVLYTIDYERN